MNKNEQLISVTAQELMDAYTSDEAASDEKYKNKPLLLAGEVSCVELGEVGDDTVTIHIDADENNIECIMSIEYGSDFFFQKQVGNGSDITIEGICKGLDAEEYPTTVIMENCLLIENRGNKY